jgi:hypothetical protein
MAIYLVNPSSLKAPDYKGRENTVYKDLDIENTPLVSEEEFNASAAKERNLRVQLRKAQIWDESPEEAAHLIEQNGLVEILQEWYVVHMENYAKVMKKKYGDIMFVPQTETLVKTAQFLQFRKSTSQL